MLDREQVSTILRLSMRQIDRLVRSGQLEASRFGHAIRIDAASVRALIERNRLAKR